MSLTAATAPLAAMAFVSDWAGDTSHDQEQVAGIQEGAVSPLKQFLGYLGFDKDADIEARRAKNREGLDTTAAMRTQPVPPIVLQLDGRTVAEVVNYHNAREASRN